TFPFSLRLSWTLSLRPSQYLRICGYAEGVPSGLEQLYLQLQKGRGKVVPHQQCPVLAGQIPCGRDQGRCGELDAEAELFATGGGMGAQRIRRGREPRGHC